MQEELEQKGNELSRVQEEYAPILVIAKTRKGRRGAKRWGLEIWELIIEELVAGTPPSAVNNNIVSFVKKFSPKTEIVELPSEWTIRRGRTVVLIVCQCIATYRLAKAERWGQLFTDGTGRRQVSFKDLVISVEEDYLFQ